MVKRSLFFASLALAGSALAAEPTPEQAQFFEGKIRPILTDKCYKCHSAETGKSKGGLTLDTREGLLKGGESGPSVKPGNPDSSVLIKAVLYTDKDLQMPPKGEKLSDREIADLTTWVKMGAPDPRKAKGGKLSGLTDKAKMHWSFQPLKKVDPPTVKNKAWCFTQVDMFILQKLEEKRMVPSPGLLEHPRGLEYGKPALLRRATYDLTGLPPTPAEIRAFLADTTPGAFAKVIDRLLASPQYGERWGRYWLDTARYSDTTGRDGNQRGNDYRYPYAWTYRDWVIKAFNDDLPYDEFIKQQLAADKIADNSRENLAALGFITVGERFPSENDVINDRIDTVTKGFLGLTVACARCHDHMFDPIPTKDYYALHGVFSSTMEVPSDELPLLKASLDPAKKADFDKKVAAIDQKNNDLYYKFIGKEATEVRSKIAPYVMNAHYRRNNNDAEALKKAVEYAEANKLDIRGVGALIGRHVRRGDSIFDPF
ncbi:MAG TPA: DUF1549 domain-containing protein, partial [Chthoniobacteraceae bacterium]|nr:DUF1549 domain-containing protein [Chthoniobacteraceae bacterium]